MATLQEINSTFIWTSIGPFILKFTLCTKFSLPIRDIQSLFVDQQWYVHLLNYRSISLQCWQPILRSMLQIYRYLWHIHTLNRKGHSNGSLSDAIEEPLLNSLKENSSVKWTWVLVKHGNKYEPLLSSLSPFAPSIPKYTTFSIGSLSYNGSHRGKSLPMPHWL